MSIHVVSDKETAVLHIPPTHALNCKGCNRPPNHTLAHAIGKEIIHCPRCDKEVERSLRSESAVAEWNRINR